MLHPLLEAQDQTCTVSLIAGIADYAATYTVNSPTIIETARRCLISALGLGFESLRDPERAALVGPLVPGAMLPGGARVPGTSLELDPAQAARCIGVMLCRPASHGHWHSLRTEHAVNPLGAILAIADYQARKATMEGTSPPKVGDVLAAIVKAVEIQGVLAAKDAENELVVGTATIRIARVASAAIVTALLGGTLGEIVTAVSHACVDGGVLVDFEELHEIGRADWARADAGSRAVQHACHAMAAGRPTYLTAADLKAVDFAGKLLGATPAAVKHPAAVHFGAETIGRIAGLRKPQEAVELMARFHTAVDRYFPTRQAERIKALFATPERLDDLPVNELLAALVTNGAR